MLAIGDQSQAEKLTIAIEYEQQNSMMPVLSVC